MYTIVCCTWLKRTSGHLIDNTNKHKPSNIFDFQYPLLSYLGHSVLAFSHCLSLNGLKRKSLLSLHTLVQGPVDEGSRIKQN